MARLATARASTRAAGRAGPPEASSSLEQRREIVARERLRQKRVRARLGGLIAQLLVAAHDDDARRRRGLLDLAAEAKAAEVGEDDVDDDDVERRAADAPERLLGRRGLGDVVVAQVQRDDAAGVHVVV